jgi:hypothetical protein
VDTGLSLAPAAVQPASNAASAITETADFMGCYLSGSDIQKERGFDARVKRLPNDRGAGPSRQEYPVCYGPTTSPLASIGGIAYGARRGTGERAIVLARQGGRDMFHGTKRLVAPISVGLLLASAAAAQTQAGIPDAAAATNLAPAKQGSLYVQCDGNPNNMSAGESIVRLIALSAVVGLLAPQPEQPDPAKRKFGEAGVAACTGILEGEKAEGNAVRRIPLMLARALHRIEAKDYAGAIRDVELARSEALSGGFSGNPYFERSAGLSLDRIEAEARIRMGDVTGARSVALSDIDQFAFAFYPLQAALAYDDFGGTIEDKAVRLYGYISRFDPAALRAKANLLEFKGDFSGAATLMEGLLTEQRGLFQNKPPRPGFFAGAAVADALAGRWEQARAAAVEGRQRLRSLAAEGKPEENSSEIVELLDFYDIIKLAHDGDIKSARRNFGARSQWLVPRLGQVLEVHARLSAGIAPNERIGLLARTATELRQERRDDALARLLERDKNNQTLFAHILPYADASSFERLSRQVWTTKTSRIIDKEKFKDTDAYFAFLYDGGFMTQYDALLLHSALQAKVHGKRGFIFNANRKDPKVALVRFVDPTDAGVFDQRYLDSEEVIAELRKIIPSPQELAARRSAANQ